ncbi:Hsp20/alpha crystallin family protein [Corallococcus praedator]|uniref:Hsp20/alpha crystallin family protein n=2 Tax=Myxococcaceae TaxID=31 RepID=A0ABX9QSH1_9BACT|nr:Hsp20/alpha crystallin family protein [Corallococcus sp. CA031C]RKI16400.1 Hsp20/alpha crystallin family protein [Corallococcus praedator]
MATENVKAGGSGGSSTPRAGTQGTEQPRQADVPRETAPTRASSRGSGISRREAQVPAVQRGGISQSPFGFFRRMMEDMDQLFMDFGMGRGLGLRSGGDVEFGSWSPQVDVVERDGNLLVRADLPGMKQEDIQVEVREDLLILEGERNFEQEEEQEGIWRMERDFGSFQRVVPLPEGIDTESIQARFEDGVLEVSMKLPQARALGRRIEVKGGAKGAPKKPIH